MPYSSYSVPLPHTTSTCDAGWLPLSFLILWWGGWLLTGLGVGYVMLFVVIVWWISELFMLPKYVAAFNRDEMERAAEEREQLRQRGANS